jgi:V/A-type H+-transporting ATPase subunit D
MADIKPTRSELIKLKNKIKLARSGHKLLKKKRDGLIMEFFEVLKKVKTVREDMTKQFIVSQKKLNIARAMESDLKIKSLALAVVERPEVDIQAKNIVGVVVPKIESKELHKKIMNRGFGVFNSAAVDEVAESYEKLVEKIILVAEVETTVRKMLDEIERTKRRVNALEFSVIPRMQKEAAFIAMRLEEMERENFSRLKMIKKD